MSLMKCLITATFCVQVNGNSMEPTFDDGIIFGFINSQHWIMEILGSFMLMEIRMLKNTA